MRHYATQLSTSAPVPFQPNSGVDAKVPSLATVDRVNMCLYVLPPYFVF